MESSTGMASSGGSPTHSNSSSSTLIGGTRTRSEPEILDSNMDCDGADVKDNDDEKLIDDYSGEEDENPIEGGSGSVFDSSEEDRSPEH